MASVSQVAAGFAVYAPYSMPGYFCLLGVTYLLKNPKKPVSKSVEFWHNMFLVLQSAALMVIVTILYQDSQRLAREAGEEGTGFPYSLTSNIKYRLQSKYFDLALVVFLSSKLYEAVDTVILILNGKQLLLLHVWHHCSTFAAFYTGLFTGAGYWIGMLNSFIHVIMYLYYGRISWIKPFAKYITSLQITHLFGGAVLNYISFANPQDLKGWKSYDADVDQKSYATICLFFCFSYFYLFLAFFSRKYATKGCNDASIWTLLRINKLPFGRQLEKSMEDVTRSTLGQVCLEYLGDQGLFKDQRIKVE